MYILMRHAYLLAASMAVNVRYRDNVGCCVCVVLCVCCKHIHSLHVFMHVYACLVFS